MIPANLIVGQPSRRTGTTGAIDIARVKHESGGVSLVGFKTYDQGREKFQGTAKDGIWLDEEPPLAVAPRSSITTVSPSPGRCSSNACFGWCH